MIISTMLQERKWYITIHAFIVTMNVRYKYTRGLTLRTNIGHYVAVDTQQVCLIIQRKRLCLSLSLSTIYSMYNRSNKQWTVY